MCAPSSTPKGRAKRLSGTVVGGFAGVGVAEVGEAAGLAGPNIYRYFDSKIDMLVDIFDRVGGRVMTALDDAVQSAPDADAALSAAVRSYVAAALRCSVRPGAASSQSVDPVFLRRRSTRWCERRRHWSTPVAGNARYPMHDRADFADVDRGFMAGFGPGCTRWWTDSTRCGWVPAWRSSTHPMA